MISGVASRMSGLRYRHKDGREKVIIFQRLAEPGEHLVVIIYGAARIKASAIGTTGSITPCNRLTIDESGRGWALQTVEAEGVQLA